MIKIIDTKLPYGRGEVIVDGVALKGVRVLRAAGVDKWIIESRYSGNDREALLKQRFSDLPQNLISLNILNVSRSLWNAEFKDNFEVGRENAATINVSVTRTFNVGFWKHLWNINEYIHEFGQVVQREPRFKATYDDLRDQRSSPAFVVSFLVENVDAPIGEEALKREETMRDLHALTEASLASKLGRPEAERIIRSIEFPPEYHRSGITILSYFADVLRHKNLSEEVKVSIEQSGLNVSLVIETPTGQRELIERTLKAYALVVTGKQPIDTLTTDPYEVAELKSQLRLAGVQIENQRELLALKGSEVTDLRNEVADAKASLKRLETRSDEDRAQLMKLIEGLVSHNAELASTFKELTEQAARFQNKALGDALDGLHKVIERGVREEDREEVIQNLSTIQREDPGIFKRVSEVLVAGAVSGAAGNYLYAWLQFFVGSLPK
jgi:DNA-binding transcriptional MerR regulator